jgi:uncharacterized membrane protein YdfJ with MMPL/SSD domain
MRTRNITERLARWSARRRRLVLGGWALAVVAAAIAIAALLGSALTTEDDFTGRPESQRAEQVLHAAFAPRHAPDGAAAARTPAAEGEFHADEAVIVTSQRGLTTSDAAFARRLRTLAADIRATRAGRVQRGAVSRDGRSALLLVQLRGDVEPVVDRVASANGRDGFRTLIVGGASIDEDFSAATQKDLSRGETFGLALALLVLVGVFGSLVAALVPIAVAAASIVVALAAVALVGQAFELNFIVVNVLVMMGLAVGIDYSLFVVSRYREERAGGREIADAVAVAGATASRAVLFSGLTVVLALVGMFLVPHTIFRSIAAGAMIVVLVSVLAALTLLPAALAAFGDRIERLRIPLLRRGGGGGGAREREGVWSRVVAVALRRPAVSLVAGVAVLVALAVPYAGIHTGSAGVGTLPQSFQTRAAYDAIERAFGPQGAASAAVVVQARDTAATRAAVARLRAAVADDRAYGATSVQVAPGGGVARVDVQVDGDPSGRARSRRRSACASATCRGRSRASTRRSSSAATPPTSWTSRRSPVTASRS